MEQTNRVAVSFAAIDPYIEVTIPAPVQKEVSGRHYVPYGRDNLYPQYLLGLYEQCSTLKAIIDGNTNYVLGDSVEFANGYDRQKGIDTLTEVVRDWYIFGYAFVQVIRNPLGEIIDLVHLPAEYVRTDKDRQNFWYCERWGGGRGSNAVVYPKFVPEMGQPTGVVMVGGGRGVYPFPLWHAALKDVEMERSIEEFHLSELQNNFLSSAVVNFNNGVPSDEEKEEIERNMQEKFSGARNAGRMMLCFNNNVQNRTTIDRLASDSFDSRYNALSKRVREQVFIAFKAQPLLFGLTSETNTGFSTTEFGDLFRLYNKTMISPVQDMLRRAVNAIFGGEMLTITPFVI